MLSIFRWLLMANITSSNMDVKSNETNSKEYNIETVENQKIPSNNKNVKLNESSTEIKTNTKENIQSKSFVLNNNTDEKLIPPQTSKSVAKNTEKNKISPKTNNKRERKNKKNQDDVPRKENPLEGPVNEVLLKCKLGEELKDLCFLLQPNPDTLERAFIFIKRDLLDVLYEIFPNSRIGVNAFGSTCNGTAFKG